MTYRQPFSGTSGIVLRQLTPHGNKFSVLTDTEGKIYLVVLDPKASRQITPGNFIVFPQQKRTIDTIITTRLDFCETHCAHTTPTLALTHHILEIAYFFTQINEPNLPMFATLKTLMSLPLFYDTLGENWRKIEIIGAAVLINICGHNLETSEPKIREILQKLNNILIYSLDFDDLSKINSLKIYLTGISNDFIQFLEKWILASLQSHPASKEFKTIQFMYGNIKNTSKKRIPCAP